MCSRRRTTVLLFTLLTLQYYYCCWIVDARVYNEPLRCCQSVCARGSLCWCTFYSSSSPVPLSSLLLSVVVDAVYNAALLLLPRITLRLQYIHANALLPAPWSFFAYILKACIYAITLYLHASSFKMSLLFKVWWVSASLRELSARFANSSSLCVCVCGLLAIVRFLFVCMQNILFTNRQSRYLYSYMPFLWRRFV